MKKLAIITTHPIQYNAPFFKLLNERRHLKVKVFYTWGKKVIENKFDPGFGKSIQWDIPLLDGYEYEFIENSSKDPGSHHFMGINNPELIKSIKNWKADAVLFYGWSFISHLKAMQYFKGKIPVFFRGDSTLLQNTGSAKKLIRKLFLTWVYKNIDNAFYVGTHNKVYYKNFGLREDQLIFAPHAIDNIRFKPKEKQNQLSLEKRSLLGIEPDEIVFLYAGKLDENKNTAFLAKAFLKTNNINSHLLIVGNGVCEKSLKKEFMNYKNIHFLPFQNQLQMPDLYAMADVFVLPSISETWGLSINEAMASGKALLISDSCGAAIDLVQNGINGFTFISDNEVDLVAKIEEMHKNKLQLKIMGDASLNLIESWNYEKYCISIEKLMLEKT